MRATPDGSMRPPAARPDRYGRTRLLVAASSGVALIALTVAVFLRGGTPTAFDLSLHRWLVDHRGPALSDAAVAVSDTDTGVCAYVLAAMGGAAAVARRPR
ncbi:Phosphoesterase PA-phosphatase related (fragment) [Frankia canadensis]|uniref:Phosphoesterase PA-phosphatase related n=1 Tax=Frankia canadensis TaxID=1836972 RepID=A0A2I2KWW1_9ACTN